MAARSMIAAVLVLTMAAMASTANAQLSATFYSTTCPNITAQVQEIVGTWISTDRTLAPSLLRLFFHDCWVRGCEGSVLLDTTGGEKEAFGNADSLRGFGVIDDIKTKVEAICPGVVSCSDILALAAREAMVKFSSSVLTWTLQLGRRDGVVSSASEANAVLPPPFADFATLVSNFNNKGFSSREMIVLSGSHTVGLAHCRTFQTRLYNFSSTTPTDPSLDPTFAASLKSQCPFGDTTTLVNMDQSMTPDTWDNKYYNNVINGKVLFQSDNSLKTTVDGSKTVNSLAKPRTTFTSEFSTAMTKMSQLGVLTGASGEIRAKCNLVN